MKPNTFLKNKKDITAWLKQHSIENYTLVPSDKYSFVVDCEADVILEDMGLEWVPVKFNIIQGMFSCAYNDLMQLEFAPIRCGGFNCAKTNISTLNGCPQEILGDFYCSDNRITSLEDGPKIVVGDYFCNNNRITSLKGVPKYIKGDFGCSKNKLKSLRHCPEQIDGSFLVSNCELENLKYLPTKIKNNDITLHGNELLGNKQMIKNFEELKQILEFEKTAQQEHSDLNKEVITPNNSSSNHKI